MNNNFEKNQFTLGIFIDFSKAFDRVDHKILISKLKNNGIRGVNLYWFESYLFNRKQFIAYNSDNSSFACGVPQGSILEPLLFLFYVNGLSQGSNILDPKVFADDTNFFVATIK